ncbi:MAG: DoxX family protein [Pyrinomonadaceae bacterium]
MAPLIFLLTTFILLYAVNRFFLKGQLSPSFIGRAALAVMLIVTGITHFTGTDLMVEMMPDFLPYKKDIVYLTGILELLAVVGLLINKTSKLTVVMLIIYFIAVLPANIIGSLKQVNLGGMESGAVYLWFRVPLQIFFIFWTYYFGIRLNK